MLVGIQPRSVVGVAVGNTPVKGDIPRYARKRPTTRTNTGTPTGNSDQSVASPLSRKGDCRISQGRVWTLRILLPSKTMPRRLDISPADRRDLRKRYARGETASDLIVSRKDLGLSLAQMQNLIVRGGWPKMKGEIAATKRRAANEVLSQVRADTTEDLESALRSVGKGFANDAKQLETAFGELVEDAAGASALQRARLLNLNGILRLHGLDKMEAQGANRQAMLAVVYDHFAEANPQIPAGAATLPALLAASALPAIEASGTTTLDFDDENDDEQT